jgi:hypothetical protein
MMFISVRSSDYSPGADGTDQTDVDGKKRIRLSGNWRMRRAWPSRRSTPYSTDTAATIHHLLHGDGLIGIYIMQIMPHAKITGYDEMLRSFALGWRAAIVAAEGLVRSEGSMHGLRVRCFYA